MLDLKGQGGAGAEAQKDPVSEGMHAGFSIASEHFALEFSQLEQAESRLREVINLLDKSSSGRFIFLFSQMVAIAEASRIANDEPALEYDQIKEYLQESVSFFNSWRHL